MTIMRRGMIAAMVAGSMAGGALGATVLSAASSNAATTTPTTSSSTPSPGGYGPASQSGGVFHSNENATHEKSESAQREAQETAGQFPTVP
jgi:hypothetical protein